MSLRTELETDLYDFLDECDPSGKNTERLKSYLAPMSDKQFYQYFDRFFDEDHMNIQIAYEPFNNPVTVAFAEKIAKKEGIPLRETMYMPYLTGDTNNPPATAHKVLVMEIPIKRLKQMVATKSHTNISITQRDAKTNQVTGHDKSARVTDVELYSLLTQDMYACAKESYGPMADDAPATYEMLRAIQRDGEVSLKDLPNDALNKTTLNTINYFLLGSGIVTNMVDGSGYLLPVTLKDREERTGTIAR